MEEQIQLRRDSLDWREVEGEIVALDAWRQTYLAANPSGAVLWTALAEGTTREALVTMLAADYDVDRERARADVDAFLLQLSEQGLLEL